MARDESDTAWKDVLDAFFKDYIDYCLPHLSKLIDWSKQCESLDKELQAAIKNTESSKRLLDKLFKVYLKDGSEQWILIHLEIQGRKEHGFPERMFIYGYKIYDKYRKPIISCAILIDGNKKWRPYYYQVGLAGSYLRSEFLIVKVLDYQDKRAELEASTSPFASVILVQLTALESKRKLPLEKKHIKFVLTKRLYSKGFSKEIILNLYRFIDWTIGLPKTLELEYCNDIYNLEEGKKMPYITSAERFGIEKGRKQALEEAEVRVTSAERFGIEKGRKQALEEAEVRLTSAERFGIEKGRKQALEEVKTRLTSAERFGIEKGRKQAFEEAEVRLTEERRTFAKFLLAEGHNDEYIAKASRLSLKEISELKDEKPKAVSADLDKNIESVY